jgi:hypothetical protein
MENLLDESAHQELVYLLPDDPALFLIESPQVLPQRFRASVDVEGVLDDLPRYARYVRGTPRKYLGIYTEEVDEHLFLFGIELGADPQCLLAKAAGVEGDGLRCFRRLKAVGMPLRVGSLSGEVLQVSDECLELYKCLGVLDALDVTLAGVAICGADDDDAHWSRHLQLEICIVWDDHELGVTQPPEHGVVGASKPYHLKGEDLLLEVGRSLKADG